MSNILDQIGNTPLVKLAHVGRDLDVSIFVKCEHLNPGGSTKDRIALSIIDDAERRGLLQPGDTLIEATAGNTGMGLALVAGLRNYRLVCVMPEKMSEDKRLALKNLGAELVITPNAPPASKDNFQNVARKMAEENGWFLTDQFENPANIHAHEFGTGAEILKQMEGNIGAFVAGVGTGGTLTGVGRALRKAGSNAKIVLADPVGSGLRGLVETGVPSKDSNYAVEGIGSSKCPVNFDLSLVDMVESVTDDESFSMALRLIREEGLLVGGSAGTSVAAALRLAQKGTIRAPIVAVLPDSWDRYFSQPWLASSQT